jgi:glycosyltransferase involved in cell wall biosynthesis
VQPIADEIIVLDSQSEDGTLEICEEWGAKVYQHEFTGFGELKRSAISKASNEWVLVIDADEEIPESLRREIERKVGKSGVDAFYIRKSNRMFGEKTHVDHPKRPYLAKKSAIEYKNDYINETLSVKDRYEGRTAELENKIIHYAYEDFEEYLLKWNQYTSLAALQVVDEQGRDSLWYYLAMGIAHWGYYLFWERSILDGRTGVLFAFMSLQYQIVVWWKIQRVRTHMEVNPDNWRDSWISKYGQR